MIFMGGGGGEGGSIFSQHPSVARYIFTMTRACTIYILFYSFFFGSIYTLNKELMSNYSFMVYIQNVQSIDVHLLLRYA